MPLFDAVRQVSYWSPPKIHDTNSAFEAVAARHGWEVVQIFSDNGVSGDDFG